MVTSEIETNLQGITYFCIQALHDHAPTDNCQMAVENTFVDSGYVPVWGT